jgi:hypothetical protein
MNILDKTQLKRELEDSFEKYDELVIQEQVE